MRVYGNQIEPGGMELDTDEVECPECGGAAKYRTWDAIEWGSIIIYWSTRCACGHSDTGSRDSLMFAGCGHFVENRNWEKGRGRISIWSVPASPETLLSHRRCWANPENQPIFNIKET